MCERAAQASYKVETDGDLKTCQKKEREISTYVGRFKAYNVFVWALHNVCACVMEVKRLKKEIPLREEVRREQNTQTGLYFHP